VPVHKSISPTICNACSGVLSVRYPRVKDPQTLETFAVLQCESCGLAHTSPQPDDLGPYYAYPYYGNRHSFTLRLCIKRRIRYVEKSVVPHERLSLLDIGCGDGSFLLAAKERGWQVKGTELNPQPAREQGLDVRESVDEFAGHHQFDCITMWHTLEHMRDIPSMMNSIARLLKPQGRLIIAVPDFGGIQACLFGPRWLHVDVPRHLYHFNSNALHSCLKRAGFGVVHNWHHELEYDLLGWSQSALNYLIPSHQNLFFNVLTSKRTRAGKLSKAVSLIAGLVLTLLAFPLLALELLLKRGGTLVTVAKHQGSS